MNQMLGEIKLFPYYDLPEGWLECDGKALHINKYPMLYMLIGTRFGKEGDHFFKLPNLKDKQFNNLTYCIAIQGDLPKINNKGETK